MNRHESIEAIFKKVLMLALSIVLSKVMRCWSYFQLQDALYYLEALIIISYVKAEVAVCPISVSN